MQNFHLKKIIHHDNVFVMHWWWAGNDFGLIGFRRESNEIVTERTPVF
jgi:hypothetical protein